MTNLPRIGREEVIVVNEQDEETGAMEKMEAHERGVLHRAFSIFIFDDQGRLLLQQRARTKYHGAELWTNTCCSHPRPGERTDAAAARRLEEELGIHCALSHQFAFTYHVSFGNGLQEHEFDHVYFGTYSGAIQPHREEVMDTRWITLEELGHELHNRPHLFTPWLSIAWERVRELRPRTPH